MRGRSQLGDLRGCSGAGCSAPSFASARLARRTVSSPAGSSRPRRAAWPDHKGVKSSDPDGSDPERSGARVAPARGKADACSVIGGAFTKLNVRVACAARAAARGAEGVAITINTDDSAVRTDHFRGQKRDVACTAAEIEDAHPWRDAGLAQETLGDWLQNVCLKFQATDLGRRMAQDVVDVGHVCFPWSGYRERWRPHPASADGMVLNAFCSGAPRCRDFAKKLANRIALVRCLCQRRMTWPRYRRISVSGNHVTSVTIRQPSP